MSAITRSQSRETDSSEEERAQSTPTSTEEESGNVTVTSSEEEKRGASRPENVRTYRFRLCKASMKTTREKARNHGRYCASKAKKKELKSRERSSKKRGNKKRGKKGKQSRAYY